MKALKIKHFQTWVLFESTNNSSGGIALIKKTNTFGIASLKAGEIYRALKSFDDLFSTDSIVSNTAEFDNSVNCVVVFLSRRSFGFLIFK